MARRLAVLTALAALLAAAPARAYSINEHVEVYGYAQIWLTLWEQMAEAQGLYQHPSQDEAADALSGFNLAKARLGLRLAQEGWGLALHTQIKLEGGFALLDADLGWTPRPWFGVHLGQFKVPGSYEALTEDRALDFALRSDITTLTSDFSLAKAPHPVSLLYGSASNLRDLGLALKGELQGRWVGGRYFLMVGNGLGANMYFGGLTKKEYFITNRGQLYWGGRLESTVAGLATLGLFGAYNRHDDIVFNSGRAVYDLQRRMIGGDLRVFLPGTGVRLSALGGGGQVRDDFNGDGRIDLRYSGWAVSAIWDLYPLARALTGLSPWEGHALELAFRFERTDQELDESRLPVRRERATFGLHYVAAGWARLQLEYVLRRTEDPAAFAPVPANDVLFASVLAAF